MVVGIPTQAVDSLVEKGVNWQAGDVKTTTISFLPNKCASWAEIIITSF
jgi:hypothetical protein